MHGKNLFTKGEELPVSMEAYQELLYHFRSPEGYPVYQSVIEEGVFRKTNSPLLG